MTNFERELLLLVANVLAEQLEDAASELSDTSVAADRMRQLMDLVRSGA